jgi:hypothetical protein
MAGSLCPTEIFCRATDIVVAMDPKKRTVRTIGGAVQVDTVGDKTWKLKAVGTLAKGPALIWVIERLL